MTIATNRLDGTQAAMMLTTPIEGQPARHCWHSSLTLIYLDPMDFVRLALAIYPSTKATNFGGARYVLVKYQHPEQLYIVIRVGFVRIEH